MRKASRHHTREGMAVAKAKGRLRGKQPKLNPRQEAHLVALWRAGGHTTLNLAELFTVARSTVFTASSRYSAENFLRVIIMPFPLPFRQCRSGPTVRGRGSNPRMAPTPWTGRRWPTCSPRSATPRPACPWA
jgi:hypothetical protein